MTEPPYQGPPPMVAPPAGWRPTVEYEVQPPRPLPPQDHAAIDAEERRARTVSYAVAIGMGGVLILMAFVLCTRWLVA
jgi:hypothetical protein